MIGSVVDPGSSGHGVRAGSEAEGDGGEPVVDGDGQEVLLRSGEVSVPDDQTFRRLGVQDHLDGELAAGLAVAGVAVQFCKNVLLIIRLG